MKLSTISLLALAGAASAKVAPLRPVSKFAMAKKTAVELRGESPSDFERFERKKGVAADAHLAVCGPP